MERLAIKDNEEEFLPMYMANKPKARKKIMMICKYFGHYIECPFKKTGGRCLHVHCEIVREAWWIA